MRSGVQPIASGLDLFLELAHKPPYPVWVLPVQKAKFIADCDRSFLPTAMNGICPLLGLVMTRL